MKTLVFGGSGYVGRRISAEFKRRGATVVSADLAVPIGANVKDTPPAPDVAADIRFPHEVYRILYDVRPDIVVHLSYAISRPTAADPQQAIYTNVLGTNGIFEACKMLGIPRVLFASSTHVYGDQSQFGERYVEETDLGRPVLLYGHMKLLNEAVAEHYNSTQSATRFVSIRLASLQGGGKGGIFDPLDRLVRGARDRVPVVLPWMKTHEFCFIHVDDVARLFATAATVEQLPHTIYNTGGDTLTMERLIEVFRSVTQIDATCAEPGLDFAHISRLSSARAEFDLDFRRRSVAEWCREELSVTASVATDRGARTG